MPHVGPTLLLANALNDWRIFAFVVEIGNQAFNTGRILSTLTKFQLQISLPCIHFEISRNAKK